MATAAAPAKGSTTRLRLSRYVRAMGESAATETTRRSSSPSLPNPPSGTRTKARTIPTLAATFALGSRLARGLSR